MDESDLLFRSLICFSLVSILAAIRAKLREPLDSVKCWVIPGLFLSLAATLAATIAVTCEISCGLLSLGQGTSRQW
jgi:hypothetical protein